MSFIHIPVMPEEVIAYLNCRPGKIYVDCTLGGSGHARLICKKIAPGGILIGIDQDKDAIQNASDVLKSSDVAVHLFHNNFICLPDILQQLNISGVDGILLDLGISLHHFESSGRGFSFKRDEPLDMRMDVTSDTKAEELVSTLEEKNLKKIFKEYGEERRAAQIARHILRQRQRKPIRSSKELAQIVCQAVPGSGHHHRIHPATRVFQALRIAVNRELENLDTFMTLVADLLNANGRLCILAFHSLEDRIVKHRIRSLGKSCVCPPDFPKCICSQKSVLRSLTRKAVRPSDKEIADNPMARSAKLRAAEKI
jgi:16S rRNA (cytosine1402-N4)-methyltransferase